MKRMSRAAEKKNAGFWKFVGRTFLFVLELPSYFLEGIASLFRGVYSLFKKSEEIIKGSKAKSGRERMSAEYKEFEIVETEKGDYKKWFDDVLSSDSKIGIIIGARGSGKTAFGMKFIENVYAKKKEKCFAMGFNAKELPSWIEVVDSTSQIENDSFVLIDEGGILFSSRNAMSSANKLLSELILIARHKNLSILFISQNSSNLDINILRQADYLVFKRSSLLQTEFERKIVQEIYEKTSKKFEKYKNKKGLAYIYGDLFRGFVTNPLPSFWGAGVSKSFKEEKIKPEVKPKA